MSFLETTKKMYNKHEYGTVIFSARSVIDSINEKIKSAKRNPDLSNSDYEDYHLAHMLYFDSLRLSGKADRMLFAYTRMVNDITGKYNLSYESCFPGINQEVIQRNANQLKILQIQALSDACHWEEAYRYSLFFLDNYRFNEKDENNNYSSKFFDQFDIYSYKFFSLLGIAAFHCEEFTMARQAIDYNNICINFLEKSNHAKKLEKSHEDRFINFYLNAFYLNLLVLRNTENSDEDLPVAARIQDYARFSKKTLTNEQEGLLSYIKAINEIDLKKKVTHLSHAVVNYELTGLKRNIYFLQNLKVYYRKILIPNFFDEEFFEHKLSLVLECEVNKAVDLHSLDMIMPMLEM